MKSNNKSQIYCPNCGKGNIQGNQVCFNCGFGFTAEPLKLFEIKETLERVQTFGIVCVTCVSIILLMSSVGFFIEFGIIGGLIALSIIGLGILLMILFVRALTPSASKIRRFTITNENIEISIPYKPFFEVKWDEFDTIEINRKIKGYQEFQDTFYTFIFTGKYTKSFVIESGKDFSKIYKKIIPTLKEIALTKNKKFIGYEKKDKKAKTQFWKDEIMKNDLST